MVWLLFPVVVLVLAATATLAGMRRGEVTPQAADHGAAPTQQRGPRQVRPERRERAIRTHVRAAIKRDLRRCLHLCGGLLSPRRPVAWVLRDVLSVIDELRAELREIYTEIERESGSRAPVTPLLLWMRARLRGRPAQRPASD